MPEPRDEWGETPQERRDRIFARDLAWLVQEQADIRDGVPPEPRDRLYFNRGYIAGRADHLKSHSPDSGSQRG